MTYCVPDAQLCTAKLSCWHNKSFQRLGTHIPIRVKVILGRMKGYQHACAVRRTPSRVPEKPLGADGQRIILVDLCAQKVARRIRTR